MVPRFAHYLIVMPLLCGSIKTEPSLDSFCMYNRRQDHFPEMIQTEMKTISHPDSNTSENWELKNKLPRKWFPQHLKNYQMGSGKPRPCLVNGQILLRHPGPISRTPGHPSCSWLLRKLNNNLAIGKEFLKDSTDPASHLSTAEFANSKHKCCAKVTRARGPLSHSPGMAQTGPSSKGIQSQGNSHLQYFSRKWSEV